MCVIQLKVLKSTWNFERFEKENELHRSSISEVIDSKRCAFWNASKGFFLKTVSQWSVNYSHKPVMSAEKYIDSAFLLFLAILS